MYIQMSSSPRVHFFLFLSSVVADKLYANILGVKSKVMTRLEIAAIRYKRLPERQKGSIKKEVAQTRMKTDGL